MRLNKKQCQRNQQLSDEELQRTQVLNLKDFKETARIERLSSKKPAIIVAAIGIFSIALGLAFPSIQSFSARKQAEEHKQEIEKRKIEEDEKKPVEETMKCRWQRLNNGNGTDEVIDITFNFKDNKLHSARKNYNLSKSVGVTEEPAELNSYLVALQSFLMQVSGYGVSVVSNANGSITTTDINYLLMDEATIPAKHKENYRFNVVNHANDTKETVEKTMTGLGYTCELD